MSPAPTTRNAQIPRFRGASGVSGEFMSSGTPTVRLAPRLGLELLLVLLGAIAFVIVAVRPALAQSPPTISITCPDSVPAVAHGAWGTGAVECTFTASTVPNGAVSVKYQVSGAGDRSFEYERSIDVTATVTKGLVHYFRDTTTVTVRLSGGTGYTLANPTEAVIAIGSTPDSGTGVGLKVNEPGALDGYTLLTGTWHNRYYLIDNQGREAYRWDHSGALGKLLNSGNLLTGHTGADIAELGPDGTSAYEYTTDAQHHDVVKLSNGHYLFIGSAYYSRAESIAAGADPSCLGQEGLEVDEVIEVEPTGTSGGTVVWKWSVWDHLIQDHDSSKSNYGVVADHPERINLNHGLCELRDSSNAFIKDPHHHTHINSIDYNASLDQILITSRHFSEVWVIDHSTTTAQAAGSTGGNSGMGGDLIYRWGNPRSHKGGAKITQELFFPHNAHWIPEGLPGAGHILVYNNGHEHPGFLRDYATVDEVVFPASGHNYLRAGGDYMPPTTVWTYRLAERTWILSNAQRLPNGNTLVTEGFFGRISEITHSGEVVWHYVSPLLSGTNVRTGDAVPDDRNGIWVYRAYKYATDHPGIQALTLVPESERLPIGGSACVVTPTSDDLITLVRSYHDGNKHRADYSHNWFRVLIAFGAETSDTLEPFTAAEARQSEQIWSGWSPVREELERLEAETAQCGGAPSVPSVSVTGGSGVTEGAAATFTVTATPAPGAAITVNVRVSSVGGYATAATRTVIIPTTGSATLSVATIGDSLDEADGSVTVTVTAGTGYTVGSSSAATVTVSDDDGTALPSVTVSGGSGVTEGAAATFTVTATPAPGAAITVNVRVSSVGGYATAATRTVIIPTTGSATLSVATIGDSLDEADGSVTVTVTAGTGYTVGSSSAATVTVSDDDGTALPSVTVTGGSGVTEGALVVFTITASPAPSAPIRVNVIVSWVDVHGIVGSRTLTTTSTIPTTGWARWGFPTRADSVDEPDGSVTVTVTAGTGYTVGSPSSATVVVYDDDEAAQAVEATVLSVPVTDGSVEGHVPRLKLGTIQTLFAPNKAAEDAPAYDYMNDHAVYRDVNGKWHVIGVANTAPGRTEGEFQFAHGVADSLLASYTRKPDIDPTGPSTWAFAPHIITSNGKAYMFYGPRFWGLTTSSDMETWTNQTLNVKYPNHGRIRDSTTPRDAMVLEDGDTYYKYVTSLDPTAGNQNVVDVLKSTDLINWTYVDHALTLSGNAVKTSWSTAESPFVVKYSDLYYMFVTITNTNRNNDNYHQTLVFRSDNPTDFGDFNGNRANPQGTQLVTELPVHAPEVILDPSTDKWHITTTGWEGRQGYEEAEDGVAIIEMEWVTAPANETPISIAGWTLRRVSSQNSSHPGSHAFDNNPTTYWESGGGSQPHTLDINLGATYDLNGFVYVPEPHGDNGGLNGVITNYELYVSANGVNWGVPVASGTFDNSIIDNNARKLVTFSTKRGQYIRFVSTAAVGGTVSRVQDLGVLGRLA